MIPALKRSSRKVLLAASLAPDEMVRGVARWAREHDWHLLTETVTTGLLPCGWRGDGILASMAYQAGQWARVVEMGIPCVALAGTEEAANLPQVDSDHVEIGRMAADHLLGRAHRSFAWAPYADDAANCERGEAFRSRVAEHGCTCQLLAPSYVRTAAGWQQNESGARLGLLAELAALRRPAAVFAFNDSVAASIVDACLEAGLSVPEDVAVLGVGDSIACTTAAVPLSSIALDGEEVGYRAAAVLEDLMNGVPVSARRIRVPPKGVVTRVSTDVIAVTDPRVARALTYIAEHYPDPSLSVDAVARAVGMSRRNLERSFRLETRTTIHEHIIGVRMREASRLLKTCPRAKSADIAGLIGLTGERTFFRIFRRHFGMSPKAHRDWAAQAWSANRAASVTLHPVGPQPKIPDAPPVGVRPTAA